MSEITIEGLQVLCDELRKRKEGLPMNPEVQKEIERQKRIEKYKPHLPGVSALLNETLNENFGELPAFNSSHEGYAHIKEAVDKLWAELKVPGHLRNPNSMRIGAIKVAAQSLRFVIDIIVEGEYRK